METLPDKIDALLKHAIPEDGPGASVIVTQDGETLFRKGYGMAQIELGVPIEPDMVFRVGSVTKQFTATAILMLAEQGKLSVQDEITRFLPDYPTQGERITIEHLLNHTSGIKSYTGMSEWLSRIREDMSLETLIGIFKDQPMDFAPGEKWAYNNSGYVLLGAIIEKASGQPYAQFLQEHIFDTLALKHTFYDDVVRLIPRRTAGYSWDNENWTNAPYLSMSQPFAAGALASTVDDLAQWDAALTAGKLINLENLAQAQHSIVLENGYDTGYGYGWGTGDYNGKRMVHHGGGINGFTCYALRIPQEKLFVAVLTNQDRGEPNAGALAQQIALLVLGQPYQEPTPIPLDPAMLPKLEGIYTNFFGDEYTLRQSEEKILLQGPDGPGEILPIGPHEFCLKDNSMVRVIYQPGEPASLLLRMIPGPDRTLLKTDKPLPPEREAVEVAEELLEACVGEYELGPGIIFTVSREGKQLFAQLSGQPKVEIYPESENSFFNKLSDGLLEFLREADGQVKSLILSQNKQQYPAKRIK